MGDTAVIALFGSMVALLQFFVTRDPAWMIVSVLWVLVYQLDERRRP